MKYAVLHEISEYSRAYIVDEFETYEEALEQYKELSNSYYSHELKFLKIAELQMAFVDECK